MPATKTKRALVTLLLALFVALFLGGCAYGRYIDQGDDAYASGRYAEAARAYEKALEEDPEGEEAEEGLARSRRALAGEFAEEARAALAQEDWIGAIAAASRAHRELSDNDAVGDVVAEVAVAVAAKADELEGAGDFANAHFLMRSVADGLPPARAEYSPRADAIRDRWVDLLVKKGEAARDASRFGVALVYFAKAAQLTPNPSLGGARDGLRRDLLETWAYTAVVVPKDDRAVRSAGMLRARIEGTALRMEVSKKAAQKKGAGNKGAGNKGAGALLELRIDPPNSRTSMTTRTESVQYQSGTRQEANPAYQRRLDDLEREQRELTKAENDITRLEQDLSRYRDQVAREGPSPNTSTGAEQNVSRTESRLGYERDDLIRHRRSVQRAREELADEPQTVEKPVYSTLDYLIERHTLEVYSTVQVDLSHTDGRAPIALSTPVVASVSDEMHGGYSVAGVVADPLSLPNPRDLEPDLLARAAGVAGGAIEESFGGWRAALLARAQAELDDAKRADLLAIYIATDPRTVDPDVPRELKSLTGIPDVVRVLTPGR